VRNRFRVGTLVKEGRHGEVHYIDEPLPEGDDKFYTLNLIKPNKKFKIIMVHKIHEKELRLFKPKVIRNFRDGWHKSEYNRFSGERIR